MILGRSQLGLLPAGAVALLLNLLLFATAAFLSRERPLIQDMTDPVAVNLITIRPPTPPPAPEEKREIPRPQQKPRVDFTPELMQPTLVGPAPVSLQVEIDPSLFKGGPTPGGYIFDATELDHAPRPVMRTQPLYPARAKHRNIEGAVRVKLLVRADGSVGNVEILEARPEGLFDAAVLKSVPRWRFEPGTLDGQAVPAWVVTWVRFELDN